MVLPQRQTYRPTEQNREPRTNPRMCGQMVFDKGSRPFNSERTGSPTNGAGAAGCAGAKGAGRSHRTAVHGNQLKMERRPKSKTKKYTVLRKKQKKSLIKSGLVIMP